VEVPADIAERIGTLCLALPEVTVRVGHPFFASRAGRDRVVVMLTDDTEWVTTGPPVRSGRAGLS
jgi:hypothetical protein